MIIITMNEGREYVYDKYDKNDSMTTGLKLRMQYEYESIKVVLDLKF